MKLEPVHEEDDDLWLAEAADEDGGGEAADLRGPKEELAAVAKEEDQGGEDDDEEEQGDPGNVENFASTEDQSLSSSFIENLEKVVPVGVKSFLRSVE